MRVRCFLLAAALVPGPDLVAAQERPAAPLASAPVIRGFMLQRGEVRVRFVSRGATTVIRALTRAAPGERLEYVWTTSGASGAVQAIGDGSTARWSVASGAGPRELRVRVTNRAGRFTERVIRAPEIDGLPIGGVVTAANGKPLTGVTVSVGGASTKSDAAGRFALRLPDLGQKKFVLNLTHPEHGPLSIVSLEPISQGRWTMPAITRRATSTGAALSVTARNPAASCSATLSSRVNWSSYPRQHRPVRTGPDGALVSAAMDPNLAAASAWVEAPTPCATGFTVSAPANAFVLSGTTRARAVQLDVSQVQLSAPDAMPGDYTVRVGRSRQVMQSFGAASIVATSNGAPLQVAPGARIRISFPVDRAVLNKMASPPKEIPLLRYDERSGEWDVIGRARLNAAGTAWTADVDHLSTYNVDQVKTDQSCVRIDASAISQPSVTVEVTIPQPPLLPVVRTATLDNEAAQLHALYNLPSNTWIQLRPFVISGTDPPTPLGTFIVNTGPAQVPTDPNQPDFSYGACQSEVALSDLGAAVQIVTQDNDHTQAGLFTPVYFGLVDGNDLYPLGTSSSSLIGIFDTGSSVVAIANAAPNPLTGATNSDAAQLGLTALVTVDLRVDPLDVPLTGGVAPMGPPGASDAAAAAVANTQLKAQNVDLSLIGAPFAKKYAALIDYGAAIPIPGSTRNGAKVRFYADGVGAPVPAIETTMSTFGTSSVNPTNGTNEPRFLLNGMRLRNGAVTSATSGSGGFNLFYDSGTTWFAVSTTLGNSLGITGTSHPDYKSPCFGNGTLFRIDRIELSGSGGTFIVTDPMVCKVPDNSLPVVDSTGARANGIVGSNIFRRVQILVDGPGKRFGIISAVTP